MQPRVTQAGPLAAPSATKIGLSQSPSAAGALALNGAAGTAVANNICASQSGTAAAPLLINGALAQTRFASPTVGVAGATIGWLRTPQPIYITSAGNDSAATFAIVGLDANNATLSETVNGTNASVVASANSYRAILSITPSANTASTVTVGAMGSATLDTARQVLFTSGGTDTGITITVAGTDWAGTSIGETLAGGSNGTPVATVLDYLTVTSVKVSGATASTISIGTNGVAGSPWINLDPWADGAVLGQVAVSGTANYTVQISNDDPDSYANPISRSAVTWDSALVAVSAQTGGKAFTLPGVPVWVRVLLNSQTNPGYVRMTLTQASAVPY